MVGHQHDILASSAGKQALAGLRGGAAIQTERARPLRKQHLGGRMHRITADDRARTGAAIDIEADLAFGVAFQIDDRQACGQPVADIDKLLLLALDDRQDAVGKRALIDRRIKLCPGQSVSVFKLGLAHHIFGIGEGRNPAAIAQAGIPADMVRM